MPCSLPGSSRWICHPSGRPAATPGVRRSLGIQTRIRPSMPRTRAHFPQIARRLAASGVTPSRTPAIQSITKISARPARLSPAAGSSGAGLAMGSGEGVYGLAMAKSPRAANVFGIRCRRALGDLAKSIRECPSAGSKRCGETTLAGRTRWDYFATAPDRGRLHLHRGEAIERRASAAEAA